MKYCTGVEVEVEVDGGDSHYIKNLLSNETTKSHLLHVTK